MQNKIKIIEIIPSLQLRGGAEVFFYNLCIELSKYKNIELYIVTLHDSLHESFSSLKNFKYFSCGKNKKIDFAAGRELNYLIKKIKPDIVHTHLSCLATYLLGNFFTKKDYVYLHTIHSIPKKESKLLQRAVNRIFFKNKNRALIGISDNISSECKKLYKGANIFTIYNGIPLENVSLDETKNKEYDLICVARFSLVKNHSFLIKCFAELLKTKNLKLICVGGGEYLNAIKEQCYKENLTDSVIFTGYVDNVLKYLKKSKCFVITSLYEGNPLSVLEALNIGLPVLAPNVGGLKDIIDNNVGYLYEPNSINDFINGFNIINGRKDYFEKCVSAVSKYSIAVCANQYFNIFITMKERKDDESHKKNNVTY